VTAGISSAVAALSVHYRDLRDLLGHLLNLLFFASPIIYSLDGLELPSALRRVLVLNPLAPLVQVFRDVAFAGSAGSPADWAIAFAVGALVWGLGTWVFSRYRDTLVESV